MGELLWGLRCGEAAVGNEVVLCGEGACGGGGVKRSTKEMKGVE
jgi:hypothetical protein